METYTQLVRKVLNEGKRSPNRTDVDTIRCFYTSFAHDMSQGLPLLTTKKVNVKACIHELLWFLKGDTNIKYLQENGVHIWDEWADANGDLGPVYGKQWVASGPKGINQVKKVQDEIINNPYSRRLVIDAWNPSDMDDMALPPCHVLYQFYADPVTKKLSLSVYQRSADLFLGVPFDIAEGGLFLTMMSKVTGYEPDKLHYTFGDTHIYVNHLEQIEKQLTRSTFELPTLELPKKDSIFDYVFEDFKINNYQHHSFLKGSVAV